MIDWLKVEARPEVKQKVEGRFLLDLRTKVNSLERQLTQKKIDLEKVLNDLESTTKDLQVTKDVVASKDEKIVELNESFAATKKELNEAMELKDTGILDLKSLNTDLIAKVAELEAKISSVEQQIVEKEEKIESTKAEFMRKFFDKNEELENTREKLEQEIASKDEDIAKKNDEINDRMADLEQKITLKDHEIAKKIDEIEAKEKEIENLKGDIKADSYDLEHLSKQNVSLVEKIAEAEGALTLFQQIKEIMEVKGFISDKEFEDLKK